MIWKRKKQIKESWILGQLQFCTVVSEVSSFVGNPVCFLTITPLIEELVYNFALLILVYKINPEVLRGSSNVTYSSPSAVISLFSIRRVNKRIRLYSKNIFCAVINLLCLIKTLTVKVGLQVPKVVL